MLARSVQAQKIRVRGRASTSRSQGLRDFQHDLNSAGHVSTRLFEVGKSAVSSCVATFSLDIRLTRKRVQHQNAWGTSTETFLSTDRHRKLTFRMPEVLF